MARQKRNQLGRAIAITGGGALVVWLLCRGRRGGRGDGASGGDAADRGGHAAGPSAPTSGGRVGGLPVPTSGGRAVSPAPAPTSVRVAVLPGDRVQIDGVDTDLHTLSERARAVRRALVDMRHGVREAWAIRVVEQLRGAGVDVQFS